ncbi:MAG: hypothetical protein ACFFHD_13685 [Promethearchaeota archaeon]
MIRRVQERINILENSIKILEAIKKNLDSLNQSVPITHIQNRINTYKREIRIRKDFPS